MATPGAWNRVKVNAGKASSACTAFLASIAKKLSPTLWILWAGWIWPEAPKGFYKAQWVLPLVLLLTTASFGIYHRIHVSSPPDLAPAPGPGRHAYAPTLDPAHAKSDAGGLTPHGLVLSEIVNASPGFQNLNALFALLVLICVLHYHFLDRVKCWEKFKRPEDRMLITQLSPGVNLILMASIEFAIMGSFFLWLRFITFCMVPLSGILLFVYATLQGTKVSAESWQKHHAGDLGLRFGLRFIFICQGVAIVIVTFLIPLAPILLKPILLLLLMWGYFGILYTVAPNFVAEQPAPEQ